MRRVSKTFRMVKNNPNLVRVRLNGKVSIEALKNNRTDFTFEKQTSLYAYFVGEGSVVEVHRKYMESLAAYMVDELERGKGAGMDSERMARLLYDMILDYC